VARAPRGLGALLTTDIEHVPLGEFGNRTLTARVERRSLRLAFGNRARVRVTLGRLRPVAVDVSEPTRTYQVAVPPVPDPWLRTLRRTALLWLATLALTWWVGRRRARRRDTLDARR
jgi:hypothetical protein